MNKEAIHEYITELVETNSEDAFHSLVESGEDCVGPIIEHMENITDYDKWVYLIDVLKEVRTAKVRLYLEEQMRDAKSFEKWRLISEARCYNDEKSAASVFRLEHQRLLKAGRGKEAAYCESFLS